MKKILYTLLTLLAVLALIVTFFANPIGKYYAQSYAQKLLRFLSANWLFANCKNRHFLPTESSTLTASVGFIMLSTIPGNPAPEKILYIFLTLLAMLALVITFFANPIGKYYAQSYAQKLLKTH
jgi:CBS domain containing-hemolysin-like protein